MPMRCDKAALRDFIDNLGITGNVSEAARLAGLTRAQVYRRVRRSDDFRVDWAEAMDTAQGEAHRRAVEGVARPVVHRGQLVRDWNGKPIMRREYSDTLMLHVLEFSEFDQNCELRLRGDDVRLGLGEDLLPAPPRAIAAPPKALERPREKDQAMAERLALEAPVEARDDAEDEGPGLYTGERVRTLEID